MERGRAVEELAANREINIMWTAMGAKTEEKVRPIRVPIYRGLLGYRIFLINKASQPIFDKVKSLEDLRGLTAGQGLGWMDTSILESAGLKVTQAGYDSLFKMLEAKRFDYFPRGANEIFFELDQHKESEPNIAVESRLVLVYKLDFFFYVNKANHALARVVEQGFLSAYKDGSYIAFFNEHPYIQRVLKQSNLDKRFAITIENNTLTAEDLAIPEMFWIKM